MGDNRIFYATQKIKYKYPKPYIKSYELMQLACSPDFLLNMVKLYPTEHKMYSAARLYMLHGYNVKIQPLEFKQTFMDMEKAFEVVTSIEYQLTIQKYLTNKELKRFERRCRNGLRNTVSK